MGFAWKLNPLWTKSLSHRAHFVVLTNERRLIARCTRFWSELIGHRRARYGSGCSMRIYSFCINMSWSRFCYRNAVPIWFVRFWAAVLVSVDRFCFAIFNYFHRKVRIVWWKEQREMKKKCIYVRAQRHDCGLHNLQVFNCLFRAV